MAPASIGGALALLNAEVHAAGWVEGGLTASFEKLVIDAELLFPSWFGRRLADLATGAEAPDEIAPFAFDRPSLRQPIRREAWLV
jgi:trimethylamine:corrinoid methyltransferase-like protein